MPLPDKLFTETVKPSLSWAMVVALFTASIGWRAIMGEGRAIREADRGNDGYVLRKIIAAGNDPRVTGEQKQEASFFPLSHKKMPELEFRRSFREKFPLLVEFIPQRKMLFIQEQVELVYRSATAHNQLAGMEGAEDDIKAVDHELKAALYRIAEALVSSRARPLDYTLVFHQGAMKFSDEGVNSVLYSLMATNPGLRKLADASWYAEGNAPAMSR